LHCLFPVGTRGYVSEVYCNQIVAFTAVLDDGGVQRAFCAGTIDQDRKKEGVCSDQPSTRRRLAALGFYTTI
jgi:hypothetical protein